MLCPKDLKTSPVNSSELKKHTQSNTDSNGADSATGAPAVTVGVAVADALVDIPVAEELATADVAAVVTAAPGVVANAVVVAALIFFREFGGRPSQMTRPAKK